MLPILYNALRAQDREYTFVFAAILGRAGEDAFVKNLGKKSQPLTKAMVVIDQLGLGDPWFYAPPAASLTAKGRERGMMIKGLTAEAVFTTRLQKFRRRHTFRRQWLRTRCRSKLTRFHRY